MPWIEVVSHLISNLYILKNLWIEIAIISIKHIEILPALREDQNRLGSMISDPVTDTDMPDANASTPQKQLEKQGASTSTSSPSSSNTSKRRRISSSSLCIFDLPDIAFVRISSYLCTPSRALLALSLTTDSKSWRKYKWSNPNKKVSPMLAWAKPKFKKEPSDQTKVILASQTWECLDFGELNSEEGRSVYLRIKDDDIAGVLACINARENLKTLKITGCLKTTGRGLQLLSGSVVLKEFDLTQKILSHEEEFQSDKLSEDIILPILNSIINTPGNSLTLIQFPRRWRLANNPELHSFLLDYDRLLDNRQIRCSKCTVKIAEEDHLAEYPRGYWVQVGDQCGEYYGMQNHTCIKCVRFFCYNCDNNEANDQDMLNTCSQCKEECCYECVPMTRCASCSLDVCVRCSKKCPCGNQACRRCSEYIMDCNTCGEKRCQQCTISYVCEGENCSIVQCGYCRDDSRMDSSHSVRHCESCDMGFCADCRYSNLSKDWGNACSECIKLIADGLGKKILKDKQDETVKYMCLELRKDELIDEVKLLQKEIEDLKLPSKSS